MNNDPTEMLRQAMIQRVNNDPRLQQMISQSPMKRNMYEALVNGDAQRGSELASQFAKSNNMTNEQMAQHASGFFSQQMGMQNFGQ